MASWHTYLCITECPPFYLGTLVNLSLLHTMLESIDGIVSRQIPKESLVNPQTFRFLFVSLVANRYLIPQVHLAVFLDRKSTRLNSSHVAISYAVFCLKKTRNS